MCTKKIKRMKETLFIFLMFFAVVTVRSQSVPTAEENIPYLVTFGSNSDKSWGDDDFKQVFYFKILESYTSPFYLRIYDPGCSGEIDEPKGDYNSVFKFSIYGGEDSIGEGEKAIESRKKDPEYDYKKGDLLASKIFTHKEDYDEKWYSFGPFNPSDGKLSERYQGYIIKLVCEGLKGDDGNLYKYYMSTSPDKNIPLEGGNAFTFEYSFRMHAQAFQKSHLYPYLDKDVESIHQSNFDWDNDGEIRLSSRVTLKKKLEVSGDNTWAVSDYTIHEKEKGATLDIQLIKSAEKNINNNNVVFNIVNQYGESMPFYTIPLGGKPVYQTEAKVEYAD